MKENEELWEKLQEGNGALLEASTWCYKASRISPTPTTHDFADRNFVDINIIFY